MKSLLSIALTLLLFPALSLASFGDYFGASSANMALGNQASLNSQLAANNYYAPSLLALRPSNSLSFNTAIVAPSFEPIENIVVKNPTNSNSTPATQEGDVSTDYGNFYGASIHATFEFGERSAVGMSVFMPIGHVMEFNTGDAFLPEYVMYRARYDRTQFYLNFARAFGSSQTPWSLSLGTHLGIQTGADTTFNASLDGSNFGSSSDTRTKVRPSLGVILSAAKKWNDSHYSFFTYTQEMKNKLEVETSGFTAQPNIPFRSSLSNMLFFDPHSFRLGHAIEFSSIEISSSVEYQIWRNYQTPITRMTSEDGGLMPSDDYENVETRDIFIPRLGMRWQLNPQYAWSLGLAHRPTPLKGDFSGSGNSVDVDALIFTTGISYQLQLGTQALELNLSYQYHDLQNKEVVKDSGREDGGPGRKIGDPGYTVGGHIHALSLGVGLTF